MHTICGFSLFRREWRQGNQILFRVGTRSFFEASRWESVGFPIGALRETGHKIVAVLVAASNFLVKYLRWELKGITKDYWYQFMKIQKSVKIELFLALAGTASIQWNVVTTNVKWPRAEVRAPSFRILKLRCVCFVVTKIVCRGNNRKREIIVSANYASMDMWRDSLRRIPPIGFFFRDPIACTMQRGRMLHGCVRWSPICRIRERRAWRLPGRWSDGGRSCSTVARWTRRRAAPAYVAIPDLT